VRRDKILVAFISWVGCVNSLPQPHLTPRKPDTWLALYSLTPAILIAPATPTTANPLAIKTKSMSVSASRDFEAWSA
jgi:hypothetical protein